MSDSGRIRLWNPDSDSHWISFQIQWKVYSNNESDSVKPASISIECLIIETGSWSVKWSHKHVIKLSKKHTNHNIIYTAKNSDLTLQAKNNSQNNINININKHQWRHLDTPTDLKSFDLPSESEMRFSVNPNPDFIIEYALNNWIHLTGRRSACNSLVAIAQKVDRAAKARNILPHIILATSLAAEETGHTQRGKSTSLAYQMLLFLYRLYYLTSRAVQF